MPLPFTVGEKLPLHEAYPKQKAARDFWRRSYWAQFDYPSGKDAAGEPLLPEHEREKSTRYKIRVSMAMTRKYTRSIIDRYNDHANRIPPERQPATGPYGELLKDATGSGTPLPALMRRALLWAQIEQCSYLLADTNQEGMYTTAAEESVAGKRGIMRLVRADQVIWWRDWQGECDEALITFEARDGALFAWYVTQTTVQRIGYRIESSEMLITDVGPLLQHSYGGCPLARLVPEWDDTGTPPTDSQAAPLAESQKRILNIDSWLLEELQAATFTTPVFLGVSADQVGECTVGPGKGLAVPGNGSNTPALGKISADPAQAESLRSSLARETTEMYRVAGLVAGNPTEVGEAKSGVALAFEFNEVEARLSALARAAERAENLAVMRLSSNGGWKYPGDAQWPNSFAVADLAVELEYLIRLTTAPIPQVLKDKQIQTFADQAFKLDADEKAELDAQIEAGVEPPADPFAKPPNEGT